MYSENPINYSAQKSNLKDKISSPLFSEMTFSKHSWMNFSWRKHTLNQMPRYKDADSLEKSERILRYLPGIVSYKGVQRLKEKLAYIHEYEGFALQIGDCAELFNQSSRQQIFQKMSLFSELHSMVNKIYPSNVVSMGRMAGQFAKPRSLITEDHHGTTISSYFGDIVNGLKPEDREPNSERMIIGHGVSCETVNNIKLFCHSSSNLSQTFEYAEDFFTCHEAYLLPYEQNLLRNGGQESELHPNNSSQKKYHSYTTSNADIDTKEDLVYASSAHFLWVGERTRKIADAHMAFIRHIDNPIGVKISSAVTVDEIDAIIASCNPSGEFGKLSLIFRFGKSKMAAFKKLVSEIVAKGLQNDFMWMCDPMHGNTYTASNGFKTRKVEDITDEMEMFFSILNHYNIPVSGLHLEASPLTVYECCSKNDLEFAVNDLTFFSACDPRLNQNQSIQVVLKLVELLSAQKIILNSKKLKNIV
ncbi:MAG: hypothetical protein C0432_04520 [Candidatus Puniceispirillum sp.]|nr:hypothetical protein [Candidatus Pelagibacter sp.]MBA4283540.1 hypothetical protein [Candidatus Puniceispirillum sp.]